MNMNLSRVSSVAAVYDRRLSFNGHSVGGHRPPLQKNALYAILTLVFLLAASSAFASSRIKDIGHFAGVRGNNLSGYGLVIGLNKTGDKRQTVFTQQSLISMLERFGLTLNNSTVRVENIAAVMVTTELPAFERPGSRIDVTVS